jgi:hypothetical protein
MASVDTFVASGAYQSRKMFSLLTLVFILFWTFLRNEMAQFHQNIIFTKAAPL